MVRTRSGDALPDNTDAEMPVKETTDAKEEGEDDEVTVSSQQHESSEEKDITYRPGWGRELRNRFVFGLSKRRAKRDSQQVLTSQSLRSRYGEEDMEESRDDLLTDDDSEDNEIISRSRRGQRESRHHSLSRRHGGRRTNHSSPRARRGDGRGTPPEQQTPDQQEGADVVRRSTRNRKQKYDNFNNTWIDGMNGHQPLRGYPCPFGADKPAKADKEGGGQTNRTRGTRVDYASVYMSDAKDDKEPSEEEEDEGRGMKRARTIAELDTTGGNLDNGDDLDMYSRVKRSRRPAKRFMFDDDAQNVPGRIAGNQTETQSSRTSTDDESEDKVPKYSLRQRKPTVDRFQSSIDPPRQMRSSRVMRSMMRRRCQRRGRSSSSSSSDDDRLNTSRRKAKTGHNKTLSSRCLPTPMNLLEASGPGPAGSKPSANALADVDPMSLDRSIMFANVGGLEDHIRCLKEMVVFPMLYPEVFDRYHIQPAKGVLFHGLPGTGKTLLARALANECSQGARKVAFFMRKGADCLTKWVGESERQLRLLFDQAYQMRPSIIFFDEIDGLAPVRSSKQDQIHASIVSTLLALMDGLDSRGEVIVVGATNRIDAIDPALRRPGRFDRELYFPLPARQERREILGIHVSKWDAPPSPSLLTELAEQAAGYCGSDLRALCSEAVLHGLRRRYPQIYKSSQKLLLDPNNVMVEQEDFVRARAAIVPAASRCTPSAGRKMAVLVEPLLRGSLSAGLAALKETFPHGLARSLPSEQLVSQCHRPHLLVDGTSGGQGQAHLGPALLHHMEHVAVHTLDLSALYRSSSQTVEEACIQVFNEARRNPPSIVYVPCVGKLWRLASETFHAVFLSKLAEIDPASPVLLLATSEERHEDLPEEVSGLFSAYRGEVLTLDYPDREERVAFFSPLFLSEAVRPPRPTRAQQEAELEELPLAPPPVPPKPTDEQLKATYDQEEAVLRELRIFLRDCCSKLARNRLFFMFTKPVDVEEVPDYLNIIERPMDLETIMTKIDLHRYACAQEFLDDIDLTVRNALEYNPDRWLETLYKDNKTELQLIKKTGEDKLIRHRACTLRDTAYALIKAEMDTDYEDKCKKISASRRQRSDSPSRFVPEFIRTKPKVTVTFTPGIDDKGAAKEETAAPVASSAEPVCAVNGAVNEPRPWKFDSVKRNLVSVKRKLNSVKKRRKSQWSQGTVKSKKVPVKRRVVRPIVPAQNVDVPVPSVPVVDQPLVNGNASEPEGREGKLDSPAAVNGHESPEQPGTARRKHVGMVFKTADTSVNESVADFLDTTAASSANETLMLSPAAGRDQPDGTGLDTSVPAPPAPTSETACEPEPEESLPSAVQIDVGKLAALLARTVELTDRCCVDLLLDLHAQLSKHVARCSTLWLRAQLTDLLSEELTRFEKLHPR